MKNISGAEAVIHCLLKEGVDILFGYPGGAIMPVYDELYKFQNKINHILVRHEQGATFKYDSLLGAGPIQTASSAKRTLKM